MRLVKIAVYQNVHGSMQGKRVAGVATVCNVRVARFKMLFARANSRRLMQPGGQLCALLTQIAHHIHEISKYCENKRSPQRKFVVSCGFLP
jgi:hypothetical protein